MCKIVIPVSFLVTLLQWTGWLNQLDFLLNPLTSLINLPPEAALPIITGMLINLYVVIAIITVLPFTVEQMTLIAIFNLIAHSLIMEGIIQHKSGINVIKATLVRITAAILTMLIVSQFLGDTSQSVAIPASLTVGTPFLETLKVWGMGTIGLLLKIFGIIMTIMILLESLKSLGWVEYALRFFRPLMKILGLSDRTAMMWAAAIIFGLFYGGAVIVEEAKKGILTKEELEYLHISVSINHAMLEDPAIFTVIGLNAFWMWVPRFIMAIVVVQTYRALKYLKRKLIKW
ncbi:nucleoside recognition domain-containing protein [Chloroflexota bacterium]